VGGFLGGGARRCGTLEKREKKDGHKVKDVGEGHSDGLGPDFAGQKGQSAMIDQARVGG
jgi:hypothetical protein